MLSETLDRYMGESTRDEVDKVVGEKQRRLNAIEKPSAHYRRINEVDVQTKSLKRSS